MATIELGWVPGDRTGGARPACISGCGPEPFTPARRTAAGRGGRAGPGAIFLVAPSRLGFRPGGLEAPAPSARRTSERVIFRAIGPGPGRARDVMPGPGPPGRWPTGRRRLLVVPDGVAGLRRGDGRGRGEAGPGRAGRPAGRRPRRARRRSRSVAPPTVRGPRPSQVVTAALEDAKKAGRPADGTALIFTNGAGDVFSAERVAALRSAAEKVGVEGPAGRVRAWPRAARPRDAATRGDPRRRPTSRSSWRRGAAGDAGGRA